MYIPTSFRIEDFGKIAKLIEENSFGTLVTYGERGLFASHLPFLLQGKEKGEGKLISHMARANPQWKDFKSDQDLLVIFNGPHAYISPSWYAAEHAVPTWNYAAVHVYGIVKLIEDDKIFSQLLQATVQKYESIFPLPWKGELPEEFTKQLMKAIVGFEIYITRMECKFKLGQNRGPEDMRRVFEALSVSGDPGSKALADFMRRECQF